MVWSPLTRIGFPADVGLMSPTIPGTRPTATTTSRVTGGGGWGTPLRSGRVPSTSTCGAAARPSGPLVVTADPTVPERLPQPDEERPTFVRTLEFRAEPGGVVASLRDFQHRFELDVSHDGSKVTGFTLRPTRLPWTTCAAAADELDELIGAPIGERPRTRKADQHCTHQIDLALTAVRFAGRDLTHRRYDLTVTGYLTDRCVASLRRDDGYELTWRIVDGAVVEPLELAGRSLTNGFTAWATTLEPEESEATLILRRAAWMAPARSVDLDAYATMAATGMPPGVCYSAQAARIEHAVRIRVGGSLEHRDDDVPAEPTSTSTSTSRSDR